MTAARAPRLWSAAVFGLLAALVAAAPARAEDECGLAANPIVCENALPGDPPAEWQIEGVGDPTIQGFAVSMSVNVGQTEYFKIKTPAKAYSIEILRLGWYGGDGARVIASGIKPTASLPQTQPECLRQSSTGLIDCGNWGVSAQWTVPPNSVSGVYIALLTRTDTGGQSQIPFVVRNDSGHSAILLQTSDATWQAYNDYGGNSLYTCTVSCPPGNPLAYKGAFAVSYNRPFDGGFNTDGGVSYLWYAEYQMMRWLEANGYNVSYTAESEVDQNGALLRNHKIFVSSGHDEYWSAAQRANVVAAREAGVNLAFFSGNEIFWKTRWGPSTEGASVPYRTLTSYKETHFEAPVDPSDPPVWTGAWRDPRWSPPADGGLPENALSGQQFEVNSGTSDITVPSSCSALRLWRNTAVASLKSGQTLTLAPGTGTLGYEWDEDVDNGFRPAGEFDLSSTTVSGMQVFTDYGSTTSDNATAVHHLTLYRAPSGALVFGAGTVQWSWGLDSTNAWGVATTDPSRNPPDPVMEQATVNLLADMGAQPGTLGAGLSAAAKSTDTVAPTSTILSPSGGATFADGSRVTVSGTATDSGGGVVAGVELSADGGSTWHPATLTSPAGESVTWSWSWIAHGNPTATLRSRAVDDSANLEAPSSGVVVDVSCPCSIWGAALTPAFPDSGDAHSVELGVRFTSDVAGNVTGIRFYKSAANVGTHVGSLWSASGTRLASAVFSGESASGWQQVSFSSPVHIEPNTVYVASYFAPSGHYSDTPYYFYTPPPSGGNTLNSPPLHAVGAGASSANGIYAYGSSSSFPSNSYHGTSYWVDPVFEAGSGPPPPPPPPSVDTIFGTSSPATVDSGDGHSVVLGVKFTSEVSGSVTGIRFYKASANGGTHVGSLWTISGTLLASATFTGESGAGWQEVKFASPVAIAANTTYIASYLAPEGRYSYTSAGFASVGVTNPPLAALANTVSADGVYAYSSFNTFPSFTYNATNYWVDVTFEPGPPPPPPPPPPPALDTIFGTSSPATVDSGDGHSVVLGVKFTSEVAGKVAGIRFYKASANTGTHIGSLWTTGGALLASATFTGESASGWQQVNFASPVSIAANTTYVAAYLAPEGHYSDNSGGFASVGVTNPPLAALANSVSPDGVYAYSPTSVFPSFTYNATNYWVDVSFEPSP